MTVRSVADEFNVLLSGDRLDQRPVRSLADQAGVDRTRTDHKVPRVLVPGTAEALSDRREVVDDVAIGRLNIKVVNGKKRDNRKLAGVGAYKALNGRSPPARHLTREIRTLGSAIAMLNHRSSHGSVVNGNDGCTVMQAGEPTHERQVISPKDDSSGLRSRHE